MKILIKIVNFIVALLALIGGIPGIINTIDYLGRSSIKINYDYKQSLACGLSTTRPRAINKLAIALYQINITGQGIKPIYIRNLQIDAKINGKWISGEHIIPKLFDIPNKSGEIEKSIRFHITNGNRLTCIGWHEIDYNPKPLEYGQPYKFSYAALFNAELSEFKYCDALRITVSDYLGHEYKISIKPTPVMKEYYSKCFLVLDGD